MQRLSSFFIVFALSAYQSSASTGSAELDEFSFHKIVSKFDAALVKFDVAFPYGDKHDAFVALAKDARDVDELLIAEVGVKDYGERDNEALALKYGASKDNFPLIKLFLKGKSEPLTFDDSKGFSTDDLRRFIRKETGIYLSLPGCVKQLDQLAIKFMKADNDDRNKMVKEVEDAYKSLAEKDIPSGKIYKTIMEKIVEKGDTFVKTEHDRVNKLLSGKVSDDKKKQLQNRINILQTFQLHSKQSKKKEDL